MLYRSMLKQAIDMFLVMGVCEAAEAQFLKDRAAVDVILENKAGLSNPLYEAAFEAPFLDQTLNFYKPLVSIWISEPVAVYLRKASCDCIR